MTRRRWTWRLSVVALIAAVAVTLAWVYPGYELESLTASQSSIRDFGVVASALRLVLIVAYALFSPVVAKSCNRRGWLSGPTLEFIVRTRWKAAGWMLAIEILVGQRLLSRLVDMLA